MKLPLRKTVIAFGLLLLLFLTFLLIENGRGKSALRKYKDRLESKGENLAVDALTPAPPPPDKNGAGRFFAAMEQLDSMPVDSSPFPPTLKFTSPGRVRMTVSMETWESPLAAGVEWTWKDLDDWLAQAKKPLADLRAALMEPAFDLEIDYAAGFDDATKKLVAQLLPIKKAARWLIAACLNDLRHERMDEALENLRALNRLVSGQEDQRLIIVQMVRLAVGELTFAAAWQALHSPGCAEAGLADLQSETGAVRFLDPLLRSMEMERNMTVSYYAQLRQVPETGARAVKQMIGMAEFLGDQDSLPYRGFLLRYVHFPLWRAAWSSHDELHALTRWQTLIDGGRLASANWMESKLHFEAAQAQIREGAFWGVENESDERGWYDRWKLLFFDHSVFDGKKVIYQAARLESIQRLTLTAIALKRYAIRHGEPAPELAALVPRFLSDVPRDPMSGMPLRYQPAFGGSFLLYSIGEDGKDDGGDSTPPAEKKFGLMTDGKDWVWPSPAL